MALKILNLRYDGTCVICTAPTPASTCAWWDSVRKEITCTRCRPIDFEPVPASAPQTLPPPQPVEVGVAGASAAATFERRAANHRRRNGLSNDEALPQHITSWDTGAGGEQQLGQFLDDAFTGTAVVLHDRKVVNGSKRGNIDHLIIASSGIWVVDAKKYCGVVDVRNEGVWKWKTSDLYVGKRKKSDLVDGMGWQSAAVQSLLEPMGMGEVPIYPVLCFVESDWSHRSNAAVVDGVLVLSPDKLHSVASQPGWVQPGSMNAIATQLSSGLPAAVPR